MFTGLVHALGGIKKIQPFGRGRRLEIDISGLKASIGIGQSLAVNGVCLTVAALAGEVASFDVVAETVGRSNLSFAKPGDRVNLEPPLRIGDALDGHMVLGHVYAIAKVLTIDDKNPDNRILRMSLPAEIRRLVAEKGSIAVDGISLTVAEVGVDYFTTALIPLSWEKTTISLRKPGDQVNLEADLLARYAARLIECGGSGGLTLGFLHKHGFA